MIVAILPESTPSTYILMFARASEGAEPTILKLADFNITVLVLTCTGADQKVYCDVPAFTVAAGTVAVATLVKLTEAMLPVTRFIILPMTLALVITELAVKLVNVTAMLEELAATPAPTSAFTEMVFEPFTPMERPFMMIFPLTLKE